MPSAVLIAGGSARGLDHPRVDEVPEHAERLVEVVADRHADVGRIGDAADDVAPEDEVDPVVLVEAEVPDVVVDADRLLRPGPAGPPSVLRAVVVAPLGAGGVGDWSARSSGSACLRSPGRSRRWLRRSPARSSALPRGVPVLGLQHAAALGDGELLVEALHGVRVGARPVEVALAGLRLAEVCGDLELDPELPVLELEPQVRDEEVRVPRDPAQRRRGNECTGPGRRSWSSLPFWMYS